MNQWRLDTVREHVSSVNNNLNISKIIMYQAFKTDLKKKILTKSKNCNLFEINCLLQIRFAILMRLSFFFFKNWCLKKIFFLLK